MGSAFLWWLCIDYCTRWCISCVGSQIPAETLMEQETSACVRMLHSVPLKTHPFSCFPEHFKPTTQVKQLVTKPFRTLGPTTVRADVSLKTIRLQSGFASHCIWQDMGQLLMLVYLISHFSQAASLKNWLFENSLLVTQCPPEPTIWTKMEASPYPQSSWAA